MDFHGRIRDGPRESVQSTRSFERRPLIVTRGGVVGGVRFRSYGLSGIPNTIYWAFPTGRRRGGGYSFRSGKRNLNAGRSCAPRTHERSVRVRTTGVSVGTRRRPTRTGIAKNVNNSNGVYKYYTVEHLSRVPVRRPRKIAKRGGGGRRREKRKKKTMTERISAEQSPPAPRTSVRRTRDIIKTNKLSRPAARRGSLRVGCRRKRPLSVRGATADSDFNSYTVYPFT